MTETRGLTTLRRLSWLMDDVVRVPGTRLRFGIDPIIGLLPGGGDLAGALIAGYALLVAGRLGAPASVLLRMAGNIAIDTIVGAIPLIGDAFDVGWKSNRRNLALLERYVDDPRAATAASRLVLLAILLVLLALVVGAGLAGWWLVRWIVGRVH